MCVCVGKKVMGERACQGVSDRYFSDILNFKSILFIRRSPHVEALNIWLGPLTEGSGYTHVELWAHVWLNFDWISFKSWWPPTSHRYTLRSGPFIFQQKKDLIRTNLVERLYSTDVLCSVSREQTKNLLWEIFTWKKKEERPMAEGSGSWSRTPTVGQWETFWVWLRRCRTATFLDFLFLQ